MTVLFSNGLPIVLLKGTDTRSADQSAQATAAHQAVHASIEVHAPSQLRQARVRSCEAAKSRVMTMKEGGRRAVREGLARRQEVEALALQAHALGARLRDHAVVQLQHLGGVLGAPVLGRLGQATRGALQARVVEACTGS